MSPMQKMLFGGEEPIERLMSYDKLSVLTVAKELSPNQVIRRPNSKQQAHIGLCPFHKENTPSFWVRPFPNTYTCYGCGRRGGPLSLVAELSENPLDYLIHRFGFNERNSDQLNELNLALEAEMGLRDFYSGLSLHKIYFNF